MSCINKDKIFIKPISIIRVSVLIVIPFVILAIYLIGSYRLENTCKAFVSPETMQIIKDTRVLDETLSAHAIVVDNQSLVYDPDSSTFYYSYSGSIDDIDNWRPRLSVVTNEDGVKISAAIVHDNLSKIAVASNTSLDLVLYDSDTYNTYPLIISTLPFIDITCNDAIGWDDALMVMTVYDNRTSSTFTSNGTIHKRGATAAVFDKAGYKINLTKGGDHPNSIDILGLRTDDDWILYGGYNDAEKIRNVFSSNLWYESCAANNQWNISAGMEYKYIELFINSEYAGLYAIGYPVDSKQLGINPSTDEEFLYKIQDAEFVFNRYKQDIYGKEKTTGSILGVALRGSLEGSEEKEYWLPIRDYAEKIYHYDEYSDEELMALVDIDNAIDVWLFINLVQGVDQVGKTHFDLHNFYVGNKLINDTHSKLLFVPWDLDATWGNDMDVSKPNNTSLYMHNARFNRLMDSNVISILLSRNNELIWQKVYERYDSLRAKTWSEETLLAMLDKYENDIFGSGAYIRDQARWPSGNYIDPTVGLSIYKQFVSERLVALDSYMERLAVCRGACEYIQRLAQYDDVNDRIYVVEINDISVLQDEAIVEFLEYLGVNCMVIEDPSIVITNIGERKCEMYAIEDSVQIAENLSYEYKGLEQGKIVITMFSADEGMQQFYMTRFTPYIYE